jgi:hypothetical protein
MDDFIRTLFRDPEMLRMGHGQRLGDLNLGFGWLYYALGRMLRPQRAVVIGSWRGFTPAVIGKALLDNGEGAEVLFVDPSLAADTWTDPERVRAHFESLGVPNVRHVRHTTQSFVGAPEYAALGEVGLLMVDGYHSAEQARFDYLAFLPKLRPDAVTLFHDSVARRRSTFYGEDRAYEHSVCDLMERLRRTPGLETMTFPMASGVTMVRGLPQDLRGIEAPFEAPSTNEVSA